jgi:hypothetical protein
MITKVQIPFGTEPLEFLRILKCFNSVSTHFLIGHIKLYINTIKRWFKSLRLHLRPLKPALIGVLGGFVFGIEPDMNPRPREYRRALFFYLYTLN